MYENLLHVGFTIHMTNWVGILSHWAQKEFCLRDQAEVGRNGRSSPCKKMIRSSGSEMNMNIKLPQGLVMEIFARLPIKSLLRFRCLSKEWLRLLTVDPYFINNLHLPQLLKPNSINSSLICLRAYNFGRIPYLDDYYTISEETAQGCESYVKPMYFGFPENKKPWDSYRFYTVGGICNGLLCLIFYEEEDKGMPRVPSKVLVWNPILREHITLPLPIDVPPLPCYSDFRFGFDQATNQYKVVRILCSQKSEEDEPPKFQHVSVYTLGSRTNSFWRTLPHVSFVFPCGSPYPPTATTVNGAPHWLVSKLRGLHIAAFDVKNEVFQEIPLPIFESKWYSRHVKVLEMGGLLCIACKLTLTLETSALEVWVMKEHGVASSWTKLFNVTQSQSQLHRQFHHWHPISIACNGTITLWTNSSGKTEFLLYNPKTNSLKGPIKLQHLVYASNAFRGSLISPKIINEGATQVTPTEESRQALLSS